MAVNMWNSKASEDSIAQLQWDKSCISNTWCYDLHECTRKSYIEVCCLLEVHDFMIALHRNSLHSSWPWLLQHPKWVPMWWGLHWEILRHRNKRVLISSMFEWSNMLGELWCVFFTSNIHAHISQSMRQEIMLICRNWDSMYYCSHANVGI